MTKYFVGETVFLDQARIYMQYVCDFSEIKESNKLKGLYTTLTSVIACLLFSFVVYYKRVASEIEEKQWDLSTVTTADFTVDIEIPNEVWPLWKQYKAELKQKLKE
jgi:hypothetical protein